MIRIQKPARIISTKEYTKENKAEMEVNKDIWAMKIKWSPKLESNDKGARGQKQEQEQEGRRGEGMDLETYMLEEKK